MKTMKYLSMALLAGFAMLALSCGGSESGDEPAPTPPPTPTNPTIPTGKHLTQMLDMEARKQVATVKLTGLNSQASLKSGAASWLTVDVMPYTSGTPEVMLTVAENATQDLRQQDVTFIATNDTLVLTVRQKTFDVNGGENNDAPFDTPSDQPALSR